MSPEVETYLALLEKRLSLLRLLAQEFVDCRKEFIALDLDGMYRRISEQEELCRQIQRLHPAICALQQMCSKQLGFDKENGTGKPAKSEWTERLSRVTEDLAKAQAEVRRLNQIHAAYLRRSRKTIQVLRNFVANYAITYAPPPGPALPSVRMTERG